MTTAGRSARVLAFAPRVTVARQAQRLARSATRSIGSDRSVPRWLVVCSAVPPVLITTAWLVAGALQRGPYSPVRQTVSVLAGYAGSYRWTVTGALVGVGICYLTAAAGLAALSPVARLGLLGTGVAAIGIAASPEPVHGATVQHAAFTAAGAVLITIWPLLAVRRGSPPGVLALPVAAAVTAVFVALSAWDFVETRGGTTLGLAERLSSSLEICWPFAVAIGLRRAYQRSPGRPTSTR